MSAPHRFLVALAVLGLLAAGCAEVDDGDEAGGGSTTTVAADTGETGDTEADGGTGAQADTTEPGDDADADAATAWALDYTGGSGGTATGEPIKIGVASNASFFPEIEEGAEIAADFATEQLGGVDGRPIELETCLVVTAEDGATCGGQFANDDDIVLVVTGSMLAGNEDLFASVAGSKPTYVVDPVTVADYTATDAVSYNTAALGAAMGGGIWLAEDVQPPRAALIITDDAAGRGAITLLEPVLAEAGIELAPVFVRPPRPPPRSSRPCAPSTPAPTTPSCSVSSSRAASPPTTPLPIWGSTPTSRPWRRPTPAGVHACRNTWPTVAGRACCPTAGTSRTRSGTTSSAPTSRAVSTPTSWRWKPPARRTRCRYPVWPSPSPPS